MDVMKHFPAISVVGLPNTERPLVPSRFSVARSIEMSLMHGQTWPRAIRRRIEDLGVAAFGCAWPARIAESDAIGITASAHDRKKYQSDFNGFASVGNTRVLDADDLRHASIPEFPLPSLPVITRLLLSAVNHSSRATTR
jgi:hypothetical protein